jgi:hypothetical protein
MSSMEGLSTVEDYRHFSNKAYLIKSLFKSDGTKFSTNPVDMTNATSEIKENYNVELKEIDAKKFAAKFEQRRQSVQLLKSKPTFGDVMNLTGFGHKPIIDYSSMLRQVSHNSKPSSTHKDLSRKSSANSHKPFPNPASKFRTSLNLSISKSGFLSNNFQKHNLTFSLHPNPPEKKKTQKPKNSRSSKLCRCVNKTAQSIDTLKFQPYYHRKGILTLNQDTDIGSTEPTILESKFNITNEKFYSKTREKFFDKSSEKFRVKTANLNREKYKKIKSAIPDRRH